MKWTVAIGLTVLLLVLLAGWSHVRLRFAVQRVGADDRIEVEARALFGLIRLERRIPMIRLQMADTGVQMDIKQTDERNEMPVAEKERTFTMSTLMNHHQQFSQLRKHAKGFYRWLVRTLAHVHCERLIWETRVGVGGAAETAVSTGLIWAIKSSFIGWSTGWVQFRQPPRLAVTPLYNREHFSTAGECILKIRFGYAITAALLLFVRILQVKGGIRSWRTILFKA